MTTADVRGTGHRRGPGWAVLAARVRVPVVALGVVGLIASIVADLAGAPVWWLLGAFLVLLVGMALYLRVGTLRAEPLPLRAPVRGRWVAINSPADRVPSHGLHAYGQTYAVDIVHVPSGEWDLTFGWSGPHSRPPSDYPGFGQPVLAPVDGTVVKAEDGHRDHAAYTSYVGLAGMMAEGAMFELTGRMLGNHVVIRADDAGAPTYVALAHLQRGSVRVRPGDPVRAGDVVGACGNSGNSSEPHVHLQVMDRPRVAFAAGLPFAFTDARADPASSEADADGAGPGAEQGDPVTVPRNGQYFVA